MDMGDYYSGEVLTEKVAYGLGRGFKTVEVVTTQRINPVKGVLAVTGVWGTIWGIVSYRKYKRGKMSKREAVADTAREATGLGLAAGLGVLVSNTVRASFLAASAWPIVPFAVGVAVTAGAKATWDSTLRGRRARIPDPQRNVGVQPT